MRFSLQRDTIAGLMFFAFGVAVAYRSSGYRMGTADAMGPGWFPFWLGVLLAVVGALVVVVGRGAHEPAGGWDWKTLGIILLSVVGFTFLVPRLGLVIALGFLVVVSSLAHPRFRWSTTLLNVLVLTGLTFVIFVWGLRVQLPVLPPLLVR